MNDPEDNCISSMLMWPIRLDATADEFGPGESADTRKGGRVAWDVIEDVTEVF